MRTPPFVISTAALSLALAWGCDSSDDRLGYELAGPPADFGAGDAAADAGLAGDASLGIRYCPSSACPFGLTTCASSRFLCDTNLLTDPHNCGACGRACPPLGETYAFACVAGECVMECLVTSDPVRADCDGIVDNGCETFPVTNAHCGACNAKCDPSTDPTQACTHTFINGVYVTQCGCPNGLMFCSGQCVSRNDDQNCGACGNACARDGGPQPNPSHAYYGCGDGKCGNIKCEQFYRNCDGDAQNGCEALSVSDNNCGACGVQCTSGMHCALNEEGVAQCMCNPGSSFCLTGKDNRGFDNGYCVDLGSDNNNCGDCGVSCRNFEVTREACIHGSCELRCGEGTADCNDSPSDGCETNTFSDPRNCGGCGIWCDAAAGQACAGGRCMLAPCNPDEETAR